MDLGQIQNLLILSYPNTTVYPWYDSYSTSISACGGGGQELGFKSKFRHLKFTLDLGQIQILLILSYSNTTVHPWCDGHSTSISTYEGWGARVGIQVFKRELHTHIHID